MLFEKFGDSRACAFQLFGVRMTERFLLLFKTLRGEMTLLTFGNTRPGEGAAEVNASSAEIVTEEGIVARRERDDVFAHLCGVRRIRCDAERADDNQLFPCMREIRSIVSSSAVP